MTIKYTMIESPLGGLLAARDDEGITELLLPHGKKPARPVAEWVRDDAAFDDIRGQLDEYFAGRRTSFDLPLHMIGSAFQKRVWTGLLDIPCGATTSYGALANAIGAPGAARAVGLANGQNPIPIIVPCHRVIGANGSLTGYGGGLLAKQWLLTHEQRQSELFAV